MRKATLIIIATAISLNCFSQSNKDNRKEEKRLRVEKVMQQEEEGVVVFRKSFSVAPKIASDGYGVFFEWGRAVSVKKAWLFQIDISERKHIKEEKIRQFVNTGRFIFGKENFFYPLKLGVQQQILLGNKGNKNGVQVTANYGGGVSLALLRPYYVQVAVGGNTLKYIKYNSSDSLEFLTGQIYNGPGLSKGWNEITVTPGVYAKTSLRFDYGSYNEMVSAMEVGLTAEYYSKKIPQMVYNEPKQFFFGAYFALVFGKRK